MCKGGAFKSDLAFILLNGVAAAAEVQIRVDLLSEIRPESLFSIWISEIRPKSQSKSS